MNNKSLLCVLSATMVVLGCATRDGGVQPRVTREHCDESKPCEANVIITSQVNRTARVEPEEIQVGRGKKARIFWKLPAGCAFVTQVGDGVFLKAIGDADDEFEEQKAVERIVNNPKRKQESDIYYWFNKNGKLKSYSYKVVFHCKRGDQYDPVPYTVDPIIINEGL
jgi:hypothetical protein